MWDSLIQVLRKEATILRRDGRAPWLLAVLGGLVLAAALSQALIVRSNLAAVDAAARAEHSRWLAQPEKYAHSAAHYGIWAFRRAAPLSIADPGVTAYLGSAVWMEAHLQNEALYRPSQDAGLLERFGALSPAVVVGAIAPLFLLLLGYGAVSREREQGTWSLTRIQAASLDSIVAGKVLAIASAVGVALIPGLLVVTVSSIVLASPDHGLTILTATGRVLLWLLAVAVYLLLISSLVVALSSATRSSAMALGIGLAAWTVGVLLMPRFAAEAAARVAPLQTQQQWTLALRRDLYDPAGEAQLESLKLQTLQRHGAARVEELPVNWVGVRLQAGEERGNAVFDAQWGALFEQIARQQTLARSGGLASPWLAFRSLSQELAGSSFAAHRDFLQQAEVQRRRIQRILNEDIQGKLERDGQRPPSGRDVWDRVPEFRSQVTPLAAQAGSWRGPLLQLLAWAGAAFALVGVAARRAQRGAAT